MGGVCTKDYDPSDPDYEPSHNADYGEVQRSFSGSNLKKADSKKKKSKSKRKGEIEWPASPHAEDEEDPYDALEEDKKKWRELGKQNVNIKPASAPANNEGSSDKLITAGGSLMMLAQSFPTKPKRYSKKEIDRVDRDDGSDGSEYGDDGGFEQGVNEAPLRETLESTRGPVLSNFNPENAAIESLPKGGERTQKDPLFLTRSKSTGALEPPENDVHSLMWSNGNKRNKRFLHMPKAEWARTRKEQEYFKKMEALRNPEKADQPIVTSPIRNSEYVYAVQTVAEQRRFGNRYFEEVNAAAEEATPTGGQRLLSRMYSSRSFVKESELKEYHKSIMPPTPIDQNVKRSEQPRLMRATSTPLVEANDRGIPVSSNNSARASNTTTPMAMSPQRAPSVRNLAQPAQSHSNSMAQTKEPTSDLPMSGLTDVRLRRAPSGMGMLRREPSKAELRRQNSVKVNPSDR